MVQFCSAASISKEESDTGQAEFLILTELCKGQYTHSYAQRDTFPPLFFYSYFVFRLFLHLLSSLLNQHLLIHQTVSRLRPFYFLLYFLSVKSDRSFTTDLVFFRFVSKELFTYQ